MMCSVNHQSLLVRRKVRKFRKVCYLLVRRKVCLPDCRILSNTVTRRASFFTYLQPHAPLTLSL